MKTEQLLTIINKIRQNKGEAPLLEINPETKLREDLGFTSFDLAELTVNIEDETDVDIFEDGLVENIGEILNKVK